jgi:hypothetical protein
MFDGSNSRCPARIYDKCDGCRSGRTSRCLRSGLIEMVDESAHRNGSENASRAVVRGFRSQATRPSHHHASGGVTRRFPQQRFTFLEGGVSWAAMLNAASISHWERRNRAALRKNGSPSQSVPSSRVSCNATVARASSFVNLASFLTRYSVRSGTRRRVDPSRGDGCGVKADATTSTEHPYSAPSFDPPITARRPYSQACDCSSSVTDRHLRTCSACSIPMFPARG